MFDFLKNKKIKKEKLEAYYNDLIDTTTSDDKFLNQDPELMDFYGEAPNFKNKLRLIFVSDTNGTLDELRFADYVYRAKNYDACIIIGNTNEKDNNIIKKYVDKDKLYSLSKLEDIKCINKEIIRINGISILGIDNNSMSQSECIQLMDTLPESNILVAYNNSFDDKTMKGLFGYKYYIYKNRVSYFVHGQSMKQYKNTMPNNTKEISIFEFECIDLPIVE